ncbi:MAG: TonB-dependent receptor [Salinivirgaceae bacterium]|jgi:iron complex outermembrane receptor protein|nr:TonB-dependent receptor [Salinivirgaceae bacterium]
MKCKKINLKTISIFFLALFFSLSKLCGQNVVFGIIADLDSKAPLVGVNVYIPELHKGTVTDSDGFYELKEMPNGWFKIQASYIGYATQINTIYLGNQTLELNVQLNSSSVHAQEITVTGGRAGSQHENAIKIETFGKEKLDIAPAEGIMQKLSAISGIDVISKGNNIATPVIRGLSTTNIVVLNNGVRMENYQFSEDHPYTIDDGNLSHIEVIKGPASLLYGSDAVGGVLNFVKEQPAPINTSKIDIYSSFSTNDMRTNTGVNFKKSANNYFGGLTGNILSNTDYYSGNNEQVPNTRSNSSSIKAFGGYRSVKGIFKFNYDYSKLKLGITNPPALSVVSENDRKNEFWFQNLDNHLLAFSNILFFDKFKLDIDLSYQLNNRKLQGFSSNPDSALVSMNLQTYTWKVKGSYDFSKKSNLILSTQGLLQKNKNSQSPMHILPDYNTLTSSLALLWQYNFGEGTFYQIGVRYDYKLLEASILTEEIQTVDTTSIFNKKYNNISFSTGLTHKLSNHLLLRGNIASAYRTPSVAELLQDGIHGNRYEKGNPNFTSQRNIEFDASLHFHNQQFVTDLAFFYNRIFDYIYMESTGDTVNNGIDLYQYAQNNAALYGAELFTKYNITNKFKINGTYSHVMAQQDNSDYLPFIPQDKINLNIYFSNNYDSKFKELQAGINPLVAFSQNKPHKFETKTDSYFLLNAFIKTQISIKKQIIDAGIYVQNILNTTYYDHLSTLKELGFYNVGRNLSIRIKIPVNIK